MTIKIAAQATLFDKIIFKNKTRCFEDVNEFIDNCGMIDDTMALIFDDYRDIFIGVVEAELDRGYKVVDRVVDSFEVELAIYNKNGDKVGEGFIRA